VLPVIQELKILGYQESELFGGAKVPPPTEGQSVLPLLAFTRLYAHAYRLLELETSQRSERAPLDKNSVAMMCYCAIHCATLGEVFARISDFLKVLGERGASLSLTQHRGRAVLTMDINRNRNDHAALLVCMSAFNLFYQLFSWMTGEHFPLDEVTVQYPPPQNAEWLLTFFSAPVHYGQAQDTLVFPAAHLNKPVIRSYQELQEIVDYLPFDHWYSGHSEISLAKKMRVIVLNSLQQHGTVPGFDGLAQLFCKSPATMRRRLKEDGTSYSKIVAECQRDYSEHLLLHTELNIEKIATKLGFTDDRSFRRSFQRWHQCTPSEYRRRG
jgi:AraC-like DNA-binding protein